MKPLDITGKEFGKLTAIEPVYVDNKRMWRCLCACGNETIADVQNLKHGRTKSCGCGKNAGTHNLTKSPEYRSWMHMKQRCNNPNNDSSKDYGDRGITVCDRWMNSFEAFYEDMGPRPHPKDTIERIDVNKGYFKENCIWAPRSQQNRNTTRNRRIVINGLEMCLAQWAKKFGMKESTLDYRVRVRKCPPKIAIGSQDKFNVRSRPSNWWELEEYRRDVAEAIAQFNQMAAKIFAEKPCHPASAR